MNRLLEGEQGNTPGKASARGKGECFSRCDEHSTKLLNIDQQHVDECSAKPPIGCIADRRSTPNDDRSLNATCVCISFHILAVYLDAAHRKKSDGLTRTDPRRICQTRSGENRLTLTYARGVRSCVRANVLSARRFGEGESVAPSEIACSPRGVFNQRNTRNLQEVRSVTWAKESKC